jgi:hypothetical protein
LTLLMQVGIEDGSLAFNPSNGTFTFTCVRNIEHVQALRFELFKVEINYNSNGIRIKVDTSSRKVMSSDRSEISE